jgi:hypothetical protein
MHDQHPRVRSVLGEHVLSEPGGVGGGGDRAQALLDRHHVVVDGLRQPDHCEVEVVLGQVLCQVGGRGVGVVTADGVQDVHVVGAQLLGGGGKRSLALLDQSPLEAVGVVGELDPAVADRAAAELVQDRGLGAGLGVDDEAVAGEQAVVAVPVGDDLDVGGDLVVALDERSDGGGQAGGVAPGGQQGDTDRAHRMASFAWRECHGLGCLGR